MEPGRRVFFSRSHSLTADGGGGRRRTLQVFEALSCLGRFEFRCVGDADARRAAGGKAEPPLARALAWAGERFGKRGSWAVDSSDRIFRLRNIARSWARDIGRAKGMELAVVEDPVYFQPLVGKLRSLAVPLIASCQNIETLSYPHIPFSRRKILLGNELDTLSRCDLAVTISREDAWLLRNFSIPTFYFPYHPPGRVKERLLGIRQSRQGQARGGVMLLGNAGNMATRKGMARVLEYWQGKNLSQRFGRLQLAGYRTDCLAADWGASRHIEFLGPLSQDDLEKKLTMARACLVFQEGGGGALTRIAEMLVAGIPVLASSHAARSYHGLAGVIEFRELEDLEGALERLDLAGSNDLEFPVPAEPDAAALVSEIRAILEDRKGQPGGARKKT